MNDYFEIQKHIPIENASKDLNIDGLPLIDDEPSEWATAMALAQFKIGQRISMEEWYGALNMAMVQQIIDGLCSEGLMECLWDDKQNLPVYKLTPIGIEYAEKIKARRLNN